MYFSYALAFISLSFYFLSIFFSVTNWTLLQRTFALAQLLSVLCWMAGDASELATLPPTPPNLTRNGFALESELPALGSQKAQTHDTRHPTKVINFHAHCQAERNDSHCVFISLYEVLKEKEKLPKQKQNRSPAK